MRLGDLLIKQDVLTEENLKKALELQKGTGKKIGEVLVENGFITEEMIARALQTQLGLKVIQLTGITIWNAFGMDKEGADFRACKNYGPLYK